MFIKQIRLKNYRCYKKAEIKFGIDLKNKKNINLATGEIKAGKTTLFNSIGWCLYGKETQFLLGTKIEEKDEKPVPNEKSYENDKALVEVEIDIKIPEGSYIESLSIRRACIFIRGATTPTSTHFTINAYHGGERVSISDDNFDQNGIESISKCFSSPNGSSGGFFSGGADDVLCCGCDCCPDSPLCARDGGPNSNLKT